jgi:hypothetical protein
MRTAARRAVAPALIAALAASSPGAAQVDDPAPLPEAGTALEAGRYATSLVGPTIDFHVDDGWLQGPSGGGPIFTLERADEPGTVLSVTRFDGEVFLDSCDSTSLTTVEASVPRLLEVIAGNPFLNASSPTAIEVDGHEGLSMDVATPAYEECDLPWLLLWALPMDEGGEFVQVADQQARFIAVDVEGAVIVIAIESFPGVPFGGLLEASLELVDSMRITPGSAAAQGEPEDPAPSASPDAPEGAEASA